MKNNLVLIDILNPDGHVSFNSKVEKYYAKKIIYYSRSQVRSLNMLFNHYRAIQSIKGECVIVSFDNICLFLVLPFLLNKRRFVFAICHNNLELASASIIHRICLYIISKTVKLIFIADYLQNRGKELNLTGDCVDFESIFYSNNDYNKVDNYSCMLLSVNAFVHGRIDLASIKSCNVDWSIYDTVYCNNENLNTPFDNWRCEYFSNLESILYSCQNFYFLQSANYRQLSLIFLVLHVPGAVIWLKDPILLNYLNRFFNNKSLKVTLKLI
jgi:hypothetical protein